MAIPKLRFTRADYDRIPEDLRVELIDGELLKMASPTILHQHVAFEFAVALRSVVGVARVFPGPVDFGIDDSNTIVPDVVVLEEPPRKGAKDVETALLVLEVLSPSTAARDRTVKTDLYLEAGVREVWLIDLRAETIELRTAGGTDVFAKGDTAESRAICGFRLKLAELFP